MKHRKYNTIVLIIFFCSLVLWIGQVQAAGFVKKQFKILETKVKDNHSSQQIAQKLSQTRSFTKWPQDLDQNLKLYIAIQWFRQNNLSESSLLLNQISPEKTNKDLWRYHKAVLSLHYQNHPQVSQLIQKLESNYAKDEDYLFLKSSYLVHSNDIIGALGEIDKILRGNKKNGKAHLQKGLLNILALSNELAYKNFMRSLRYLPKKETSKRQQAYLQAGVIQLRFYLNHKKAKTLFEKGIALEPHSGMVKELRQYIQSGKGI